MNILNGRIVKEKMAFSLKKKVLQLAKKNIVPHLLIIQVGSEPASNIFIKNKIAFAKKICCKTTLKTFLKNTTTKTLIDTIKKYNDDPSIHGIIVQLPLPINLDQVAICNSIDPKKDVDGFNWFNVGGLWTSKTANNCYVVPGTSLGIIELLKYYNICIEGKNVCIIGRSNIVSKPLAALFLQENATVTICHSKTKNLSTITKQSDILVVAIGKQNFVTKKYLHQKQIVIDVGINYIDNKIFGDIKETDKQLVKYATPVPGGVGQMTIACLFANLIKQAQNI